MLTQMFHFSICLQSTRIAYVIEKNSLYSPGYVSLSEGWNSQIKDDEIGIYYLATPLPASNVE